MFPSNKSGSNISLFVAIAFSISVTSAFAAELKSFNQSSFEKIEVTYRGLPFMVAIWSIECPPCMTELKTLGKLKQEDPDFNLVLICTDTNYAKEQIKNVLASHSLADIDSWVFSTDQPERLRYSIDPDWFGEIPRSYRYSGGGRKATSGLIDEEELRTWIVNRHLVK